MGGGGELLQFLAKGSQVEVSTDEEGFRGAWYVATVLDPPPRSGSKKKNQNSNRVYVEYHSLLADEDGSKPLREHVNVAFVRPSPHPPPEDDLTHSFELNDVVDAFYRDGWWTGVITRVLDNSRFVVTFQSPPDEIEFGLPELRVHREWVHDKWIRPEKQRTTGLMFSAGKKVEVSFGKEDHHDVWFPAIVLEDSGNNSYLVEYWSLGNDVEARILKETVDSHHIRPSPPHLKDKNFVLLEKVDALYDFGWWSGVITKELADSRYIVFFKHINKEREVNHSELRPHMEWIDGKWVSASQDVLIPSDYQEHVGHACNNANITEMAVQLGSSCASKANSEERTSCSLYSRENQTEQSTPCDEKPFSYGTTSLKKKTKQTTPDTDASHSRPLKKLKEGNTPEEPSLIAYQLITTPVQAPSKGKKQPMVGDQPSARTKSLSRGKKVQSKQQKVGELDNQTTGSVKRKGRQPKSQVKCPQPSVGGKEGKSEIDTAEEFVEKECITKEIDIPVVIGLACNGMRDSQAKKPHHLPGEESLNLMRDQKQQLTDPARHKIKEINQLEAGGESNQKRRRGRPPKLLVKGPQASVAGREHNGDVVAADVTVVKDCITSEGELPTTTGVGSTRMRGSRPSKEYLDLIGDDKNLLNGPLRQKNVSSSMMKTPSAKKDKLPNEKVVRASSKQVEKISSKRGRRRSISVNIESPIQDAQNSSRGKPAAAIFEADCMMKGVEMAIDELPSSVSDDQPLSKWFEGMHSPTTVDVSRVSPGRTVQQCTEASERQNEIAVQSPTVVANGDTVPDENQSLPFVKTFPLWETIESMEVFRVMPQKPHFHPLDSCKESSREGLAIGSMVTFSSVVKKTLELHFDDPRSTIEDSLETLFELESQGFDVKIVRDRLTGLLLTKDKQEVLQDQSKELKSQIMEHSHEKTKIDEEIDEIDKQIRDLQEKRALAMSMKEIKDSEIASLQSTVKAINEDIKRTQLDFEGLAASPW